MKKLHFLVIGKHPEILNILVRLLNAEENWSCKGYSDELEALATENLNQFDILLLSSGLDEATESMLQNNAKKLNPNIKTILHYGGGSGLLKNEIQSLLAETNF